jgi:hypothetical protein
MTVKSEIVIYSLPLVLKMTPRQKVAYLRAAKLKPADLGMTARELGISPRQLGTNPRALGTNPRSRRHGL